MSDLRRLTKQTEALLDGSRTSSETKVLRVPGILLLRHTHPTNLTATLYEPVVCLILQGQKEIWLGQERVRIGAGQCLVVSHDVPVISRIIRAKPNEPYLAVIMTLDLALLRSLYDEVAEAIAPIDDASPLAVHLADDRLFDAVSRYVGLADDPVGARVIGSQVRREVHFRLLMAPNGGMLRRLLRHDSSESRVARAIAHIRHAFRAPLFVPELAREIGMSPSAFHKHFKTVTRTTPLQYQKELRLLEARRLLSVGEHNVTTVALEVGYESPSQFSREYARKFGGPPRRDIDGSGKSAASRSGNSAASRRGGDA